MSISGVDALVAALEAGDPDRAMVSLEQFEKDTDAANAASIAYGMTVCGE